MAAAVRGLYRRRMTPISFKRHRFPPVIIQHAVWLYARFTLSFRDVEELLAERGIDVSNETVRRWFLKFGRLIARNLRRSRPRPGANLQLDEMVIKIRGRQYWLWRVVDDEGEVLDFLVQRRRCARSAGRLLGSLPGSIEAHLLEVRFALFAATSLHQECNAMSRLLHCRPDDVRPLLEDLGAPAHRLNVAVRGPQS